MVIKRTLMFTHSALTLYYLPYHYLTDGRRHGFIPLFDKRDLPINLSADFSWTFNTFLLFPIKLTD